MAEDTTEDRTRTRYEEFTVAGSELLDQVKRLIAEGNVRRVYIKNSEGRTLLEVPLNAGVAITVVTAAVAPVLVAVGAIAAMLTQATVGVERDVPVADVDPAEPTAPAPDAAATEADVSATTDAAGHDDGPIAPPPVP